MSTVTTTTERHVGSFGLAVELYNRESGFAFLSATMAFDMEQKNRMNKKHRETKEPNPYLGKGLVKYATFQGSVNLHYDDARQRRGGKEPQSKGSWHTALLLDGHVTPISTHKGDVETYLPSDAEKDTIHNRRAVVDNNGNLNVTASHPRFYLRAEIKRESGEGSRQRQDREARWTTEFRLPDGTIVPYSNVAPYLPKRDRDDETDLVMISLDAVTSLNIDGIRYVVE